MEPVGYPGGFWLPGNPPPAMIFFNQGGDTNTGTDLYQPLRFATFGNPPPPETNSVSGHATVNREIGILKCMTSDQCIFLSIYYF